jgi:hypothetical protein
MNQQVIPLALAIQYILRAGQPRKCIMFGCPNPAAREGVYGPVCFDHIEYGGLQ